MKKYYLFYLLFSCGDVFSIKASPAWYSNTGIEGRNRLYVQQDQGRVKHNIQKEAEEFQSAQYKYQSIITTNFFMGELPTYEDTMFYALINEGFSKQTLLGRVTGLYIKDLNKVAFYSSGVSRGMMRAVLAHLCLQSDTGVMVKEICNAQDEKYIVPITADDIILARQFFPLPVYNCSAPGSYALDEFLSDQLYRKLPE